ncbi:MAG: LysR family transcriptional regulator [Variovorax sp.]|nr:MAG: LysR family transcriptional regulator [Variovorax sp.]
MRNDDSSIFSMCYAFDLNQIGAFSAVMTHGGITAAAQALGRAQSVVTRQIQDLEARLGFALFDREGRGVAPTERGRLFHVEVERHLAGLERLGALADAIRVGAHASLDIASIPAFAAGLLPLAIARLPDVEATPINLRALGGEEVAAQVRGRLSDLGFCSLPVRGAGLQVHWAIEVDCVAVLREEDPLAAHAVLPLKALDGRRLITTANPYRQRRHVDEALQGAGLSRRTPLDTNTSLSAMASVRAGLGIALIEPLSITGAPMHGLVQRPLDVALPFRYGVITRGGFELPAHLRELISHVAAVIREAIPSCVQMPAARDDVMGASGAARATRAGRAAEAKDGTRS